MTALARVKERWQQATQDIRQVAQEFAQELCHAVKSDNTRELKRLLTDDTSRGMNKFRGSINYSQLLILAIKNNNTQTLNQLLEHINITDIPLIKVEGNSDALTLFNVLDEALAKGPAFFIPIIEKTPLKDFFQDPTIAGFEIEKGKKIIADILCRAITHQTIEGFDFFWQLPCLGDIPLCSPDPRNHYNLFSLLTIASQTELDKAVINNITTKILEKCKTKTTNLNDREIRKIQRLFDSILKSRNYNFLQSFLEVFGQYVPMRGGFLSLTKAVERLQRLPNMLMVLNAYIKTRNIQARRTPLSFRNISKTLCPVPVTFTILSIAAAALGYFISCYVNDYK